jgi:hypothetical protein
MKKFIRKITPNIIKKFIKTLFLNQFKWFFTKQDLLPLSKVSSLSADNNEWSYNRVGDSSGIGGWFSCDNHSHGYHGLLKQWWEFHGLGNNTLLISESVNVRNHFERCYPDVKFIATDYFLDAGDGGVKTDVIWNIYKNAPDEISNQKIDAIICQATYEHLLDPIGVLERLAGLLTDGGILYIHTHTPLYPYHACPRDYLRFNPDWFSDATQIVTSLHLQELHAELGHIFACYKKIK